MEPRRGVQPYVIPANRNRKSTLDSNKVEESLQALSLSDDVDKPSAPSSEPKIDSCCVIISGFSGGISREARENMISRFYSSGGKSQWLDNITGYHDGGVVLFAYSTERKAASVLQQTHPCLRVCLLGEYTDENYIADARRGTYQFVLLIKY